MVEDASGNEQVPQREGVGPKQGILGRLKRAVSVLAKPFGAKSSSGTAAQSSASSAMMEAVLNIHKLDLKTVNRILVLVLVGLIALACYFGFSEHPTIEALTASVSKMQYEPPEETVITPFEELSVYQEEFKKRDIFNEYEEPKPPPPPVVEEVAPPPPPPPKVTIQEKAKNLKLMGVSWGSSPKAMVQNQATGEVLFLEEGQPIKGTEIKIKSIAEQGVIIESDGDEMKMF